MKSISPSFVNRLLSVLTQEAEACYSEHRREGTYPNTTTTGVSRALKAVEYALPEHARGLGQGYVAVLRYDAPANVRSRRGAVAANIRRLICTFDKNDQRRLVNDPTEFSVLDPWIGRAVNISTVAMDVQTTEMYPHDGSTQREPLNYGLRGILLDYNADRESVCLASGGEVLCADVLFPLIVSLHIPTQVVRTMPVR